MMTCLLSCWMAWGWIHPIHISVMEIHHNEQAKSLEVAVKIFADDLQDAIYEELNTQIDLMDDELTETELRTIHRFIQKNIRIQANDKPCEGQLIGAEHEGMALWIYVEFEAEKKIKSIQINNEVFTQKFADQQNIIHISVGDQAQTCRLGRAKTVCDFEVK